VNSFFGIPAHAEADAGHGAAAADDHAAPAADDHGAPAADDHGAPAEGVAGSPGTMTLTDGTHMPMPPVAPTGAIFMAADNTVIDDAHHAPTWVKISPFIAMLLGLATAYWFYIVNPTVPRRLAESQPHLYQFLLNKWYFDEVYDAIFVRPAKALGRFLWKRGDGNMIDGFLNGVAMGIVPWFTRLAGRAQSGFVFTYAFAMVLGIVVLITIMTLFTGAH